MGDQRTNNPNHLPEPDDLPSNVGDGPVKDSPSDTQEPGDQPPPAEDPNPGAKPAGLPGQQQPPMQDPPESPENPTSLNDDPPPIS
ncbi:hypothetical protein D3875_12915 [Deinococcus cavernae]|uniref:Uncharacterized protein n=1 Tax=Deinococcus cavernae TaxID=2320857 RepID=A0A418V897_9DEIO|nr:hypothetical protein [Deinococcus cavernae]RJF72314.1 hypothetical protein D3875_12915 [Deinococcus cavernae]